MNLSRMITGIGILFVTFVSILHTVRRILQPPARLVTLAQGFIFIK